MLLHVAPHGPPRAVLALAPVAHLLLERNPQHAPSALSTRHSTFTLNPHPSPHPIPNQVLEFLAHLLLERGHRLVESGVREELEHLVRGRVRVKVEW